MLRCFFFHLVSSVCRGARESPEKNITSGKLKQIKPAEKGKHLVLNWN